MLEENTFESEKSKKKYRSIIDEIEAEIQAGMKAASKKDLNLEEQLELAGHEHWEVRRALAVNTGILEEVALKLVQDEVVSVIESLSKNTPLVAVQWEILKTVDLKDPYDDIVVKLMKNENLAEKIQEDMSKSSCDRAKWSLTTNQKLTNTAFINLSKDSSEYVRRYLGESQPIPEGKEAWELSAVFLGSYTILYEMNLDFLTKEEKSILTKLLDVVSSKESLQDVLNCVPKIMQFSNSQKEIFFKLAKTWENSLQDLLDIVLKI